MAGEKSRECTVCVRSVQTDGTGEVQKLETRNKGRLSEREGVLYVLYKESVTPKRSQETDKRAVGGSEAAVGTGTKSLLKIEEVPLRASLKKSGEVSWKMCFEAGRRESSEYRTPYGAFEAGVETEDIILKKEKEKTSLQLLYTLFIQGEKQADCRLEIEIL